MRSYRDSPAPSAGPLRRPTAGVTLLDLILVTLVMSILAVVGVPAMHSSLSGLRLTSAADEVIAAVEYAQMTALATSGRTRVTFDVGADTVSVEEAVTASSIASASGPELTAALIETTVFQLLESPWEQGSDFVLSPADLTWLGRVDVASVDFGGDSWVVFDPWGAPSTGGTLTLSSEGRQVVLSLDAQTGKVTLP